MTTDAETWALVDDQRRRTIALLGSLSPADWDAPSLCSDWTVKDVVGHLAWQRAASSASSLPLIEGPMAAIECLLMGARLQERTCPARAWPRRWLRSPTRRSPDSEDVIRSRPASGLADALQRVQLPLVCQGQLDTLRGLFANRHMVGWTP